VINQQQIRQCLPALHNDLYNDILQNATYEQFEKGQHVVRQGAYLDFLPIVLDGVIKMYAEEDSIQFLLYYINPSESCIMSFNHLFAQEPIKFSAISEGQTTVLCLPIKKVKDWFVNYPSFGKMIISDYQRNFDDLLRTTKDIICFKIEDRLVKYLQTKSNHLNSRDIHLSHQSIII